MVILAVLLPAVLLTTHSYNPPSVVLTAVMFTMLFKMLSVSKTSSLYQRKKISGPPEAVQFNVRTSPYSTTAGLAATSPVKSAVIITS